MSYVTISILKPLLFLIIIDTKVFLDIDCSIVSLISPILVLQNVSYIYLTIRITTTVILVFCCCKNVYMMEFHGSLVHTMNYGKIIVSNQYH